MDNTLLLEILEFLLSQHQEQDAHTNELDEASRLMIRLRDAREGIRG